MPNYSTISFLALLALTSLSLANLSTKELLECRANLTAAIKNDTTFLGKVRQSDYIFTGKVKELRHGQLLHARVKRAIKGALNATVDLTVNDTCGHYIRRGYTGIFMARRGAGDVRHVDKVVMHFGPVPLTLANLDRLNAAVRGSNENEIGTPKKRRFHEPRFISEITLLDLSTPRKAQRMLKFIKNKNQEKAKKIQRLQSINRYQKIRITSLENTIKHLKDKGCPMKQKIH